MKILERAISLVKLIKYLRQIRLHSKEKILKLIKSDIMFLDYTI